MQKLIALRWTVPAIAILAVVTIAVVIVAVAANAHAVGAAYNPPVP